MGHVILTLDTQVFHKSIACMEIWKTIWNLICVYKDHASAPYVQLTGCRIQKQEYDNDIVAEHDVEKPLYPLARILRLFPLLLVTWAWRCCYMKIKSHALIALSPCISFLLEYNCSVKSAYILFGMPFLLFFLSCFCTLLISATVRPKPEKNISLKCNHNPETALTVQ